MKFSSKINTFYIYDKRNGFWVALGPKEFEKSIQQILNQIDGLKTLVSPARYAKRIVEEATGTSIQCIDVPEFDMDFICLRNCLINTITGERKRHSASVFLTSGTQYEYDENVETPN